MKLQYFCLNLRSKNIKLKMTAFLDVKFFTLGFANKGWHTTTMDVIVPACITRSFITKSEATLSTQKLSFHVFLIVHSTAPNTPSLTTFFVSAHFYQIFIIFILMPLYAG